MSKFQKIIITLFVIISFVGLVDAGYLTYEHYAPFPLPCSNFACETVTTSKYSVLFGVIPLSLMGMLYYITILVGSIIVFVTKSEILLKLISSFTVVGFLTSLYLVYLQLFVLDAICIYCMISAGTSTLLFVVAVTYLLETRRTKQDTEIDVKVI